jgi:uncharacterized membrane protein affecting hemolysin expression
MFKGLAFSRKHASILLLVGVIVVSLTLSQMHLTEGMETPTEPTEPAEKKEEEKKEEEKKEEFAVQPAAQSVNHGAAV